MRNLYNNETYVLQRKTSKEVINHELILKNT